MSAFLRKYGAGTGADIIIPIVKAGVVDFAVSADWTPAAGDVKISKDGGAAANITTLPTFITSIGWKFVFSDAELQAARINVNVVDSATKAIEDQHIVIETYGNSSAQHALDLDTALTAAGIADQVWDEATTGHTTAGTFGEQVKTDVDAILVDTSEIGAAGAGLTDLGGMSTTMKAQVNTEVDSAFTTQMADSVSTDGSIATREQALYMMLQFLTDKSTSGTTVTVKKVDGATSLFTLTLDDATTPTSITRS